MIERHIVVYCDASKCHNTRTIVNHDSPPTEERVGTVGNGWIETGDDSHLCPYHAVFTPPELPTVEQRASFADEHQATRARRR